MQMFLILQPGTEPVSSAVNMQSPNQRPTKEFPKMRFYNQKMQYQNWKLKEWVQWKNGVDRVESINSNAE